VGIGVEIRRRTKAAIPPVVLMALVGYFLWQAQQGERGLKADAERREALRLAQAELARAEADLSAWERRVTALRASRLDRDILDERARAMLNLSDPADIIVPYGQGQRLF
jgi:cell division protein FtsB